MGEAGIRIIYVDDEEYLLELAKEFLEQFGDIEVDCASSADQAMMKLSVGFYDGIISDYQMPLKDGLALLSEVRREYGALPFIIFTGRGRESVTIKALELGANFYMQKGGDPIPQFTELYHKIKSAVEKYRLQESVKRNSTLMGEAEKLANMGSIRYDFQTRKIDLSPQMYLLLGLPEGKDASIDDILKLTGEEVAQSLSDAFREAVNRQESQLTHSFSLMDKDGVTRYYRAFSLLEYSSNGKPIVMTSVWQDIGWLIEARENLKENARLNALLDTIDDVVLVADVEGRVIRANRVGQEVFGGEARLLGRNIDDLIQGMDGDEISIMGGVEGCELNAATRVELCTRSTVRMPVEVRRSRGKWDGQEVLVFVARDISDSLRAERAAKEGEANFRAVFESITDLIYVGNQEGRILYCNQAVIQKLGYSQQELANMHILDLHQKERREEAETILSAMFEGKQDQCPLPLVRRDGSILSVQTRCWFGQWGGRECVFGISKDMTEEQEAQQRFEGMFRKNPTPMALSEFGNCRFFDVNDAFTRQLGYSRSEIIGRTSRELGLFLCPEEHEHLREEVRRMMSISDRELQVRCKDGTVLDGLFSGQIIASQEKKFFLTVMVDITARNRANGEILRTKELLSLATRAGGVGIWDYRAEDESVKWDAQMFKLYGIDEKDFSGKNMDFVARVIPEDRPRVVEEIQAALAGTKEFNTEFRIRWPDGSVHHIRAIAEVQLDESGRPMRVVGTNWDVTARNEIRRTVDNQTSLIDSLLRSIADIVFYKDLDGVYLGCNPAFADFVGKPEDKIIGKTDYDLFSQEIADSFRENDWQMMRHCAPRKNDEWITYPNGKRRFVETMKSPYWGPDGKIIGILGISRDITNRK